MTRAPECSSSAIRFSRDAGLRRGACVAAALLVLAGIAAAAEAVVTPTPVGAGTSDPIIPAPGMGWVAYCLELEIREGSGDLPDLLQDLQSGINYFSHASGAAFFGGHCRVLYIRLRWREFEELKENALLSFLEEVEAFNAAESDVFRKFHVFLAVTFEDTCFPYLNGYPDGWGIDDFPPYIEEICACDGCPQASDALGTYLLDYCLDPDWILCISQAQFPPYYSRYQLREPNYFNPATLPAFIAPWNQELADYVARFECISGVHAGFMGNWGQNHLAMFTAYGRPDPPRDWTSFRDNIDAWFADFRQRLENLPRRPDIFFSENYHWQIADNEGHQTGLLLPQQSIVTDMFGMARENGYTLHLGGTAQGRLPDASYELALREAVKSTAPYFCEWDSNESLADEFTFYPNFMQLNMCGLSGMLHIGCWGLQDAVWSYATPTFQYYKNRLGYRFQLSEIRRDRTSTGGYVRIKFRNIGAGFCVNPVRLTLWKSNAQGDTARSVVEIPPEEIRHLRADDLDELEVHFDLPALPPIPGSGEAWRLSLEVYDYWTQAYLPVSWSNREGATITGMLTVYPLLGDLDGDFKVEADDAALLADYLGENYEPTLADPGVADFDGDGEISLRDLVLMKRRLH